MKVGDVYKTVFSDYYTSILTLKDLPIVPTKKSDKSVIWNLAKEWGWTNYKELTEKYSKSLENAIEVGENIEDKMKKFNNIHEKIKFKTFGKITVGRKQKESANLAKRKGHLKRKQRIYLMNRLKEQMMRLMK